MRQFVSYQSEYDRHIGSREMSALPVEGQDELIRIMFDPGGDSQRFVIDNDIDKCQPDALWTILVAVGCFLERRRRIPDFAERTPGDCMQIVNQLRGTLLARRLIRVLSPSNSSREAYDWSEIESFGARDAIAGMTHDNIVEDLRDFLMHENNTAVFTQPIDTVMPKDLSVEGINITYLNGPMAVQAYRLSPSLLTTILPFMFLGGLISFIPIGFFVGLWWGVATLIAAILARKYLTTVALRWVVEQAHADLKLRSMFLKHGIIKID